jgi:uncharacterized protein YvpB
MRNRIEPLRLLAGAGIIAAAFIVFLPIDPLKSTLIGVQRNVQVLAASVMPKPKPTNMLVVPFHKQEHALSCEIASLRSALLAIGADVSETKLLSELPKDPTKHQTASNGKIIWGDPNIGFVGSVDGKMPRTGYGVYEGPVMEVALLHANATNMRSDDAAALTAAIDRGHPVIAWIAIGSNPKSITWTTPHQTVVKAALYEHTVVVSGYKRTGQKVDGVYVVDPLTGPRYDSWSDFQWRTGFLDHRALEIGK